jgi:NADH:ubiquinone oxidoreductase subunit K
MSLNGAANLQAVDVTLPAATTPSEAQLVVNALNEQNARVFKITVISTVVVGLAALLNTYRTFRQLRREDARDKAMLAPRPF